MSKGILGIEVELLEEILRNVVRQEMAEMRDEIKQTLISKRESLFKEERLYTDQVGELLDVSRHTIYNHCKNGKLPQPKRDISGRPYWTIDQLEIAMKLRGIKTNYPV